MILVKKALGLRKTSVRTPLIRAITIEKETTLDDCTILQTQGILSCMPLNAPTVRVLHAIQILSMQRVHHFVQVLRGFSQEIIIFITSTVTQEIYTQKNLLLHFQIKAQLV